MSGARWRPRTELQWTALALALAGLAWACGEVGAPAATAVGFALLAGSLGIGVRFPRVALAMLLLAFPLRGALTLVDGALPVSSAYGAALVLGTAARWIRERRWPRRHPALAPLAGLVALAALSLAFAAGEGSAWEVTLLLRALAVSICVLDLADDPRAVRRMAAMLLASAALASTLLLADWIGHAVGGRPSLDPLRYRWPVSPDSTLVATFLGAGYLAALTQMHRGASWARRGVAWVVALPVCAAMVALESRLVWAAVAVALVVHVVVGRGRWRRLRQAALAAVLPLALVAGALALGLTNHTADRRVERTFESPHTLTSGRTTIWAVAWQTAVAHPWVGIGPGAFPAEFERVRADSDGALRSRPARSPHGELLGLAAELGFLAPLLLLAALGWLAAPFLGPAPGRGPAAMLAMLAYVAAVMCVQDQLGTLHPWVVFGLAMGAGRAEVRFAPLP